MKTLTPKAITESVDFKLKAIEVPEWSQDDEEVGVWIRTPSAKTTLAVERCMDDEGNVLPGKDDELLLALLVGCVCNAKGRPIYNMGNVADLLEKSPKAILRISNAIRDLNKENAAKKKEDLAKN